TRCSSSAITRRPTEGSPCRCRCFAPCSRAALATRAASSTSARAVTSGGPSASGQDMASTSRPSSSGTPPARGSSISIPAATVPPSVEEFLRRHSPVIGAVASIGPEYGLPLIAEAAVRLRPAYPRLGLLLMGPAGFERADLDGSLLLAGQLPHDTALAVMGRMNVFVRPTYFDGDASSV